MNEETTDVFFDSVLEEFPGLAAGGHVAPSEEQIRLATPRLTNHIEKLAPDVVLTLGVAAAKCVLTSSVKTLDEIVGQSLQLTTTAAVVPVVALPHPSGRSTWVYRSDANRRSFQDGLRRLRRVLDRGCLVP